MATSTLVVGTGCFDGDRVEASFEGCIGGSTVMGETDSDSIVGDAAIATGEERKHSPARSLN